MNTLTNRGATAPFWLAMSLSLIAPTSLWAGETWDGRGKDANWSTANNWNPNQLPSNDGKANLVFSGKNGLSNTMDGAWSIYTLTFAKSAKDFTITSKSDTLTLAAGLANNSSGNQTLDVNLALGGSQTWFTGSGDLVIGAEGANRILEIYGHLLTLNVTGNVVFNSQFTGEGGLIKEGAGTATLSYGGNSIFSSYSGETIVREGTLISDPGTDTGTPVVPLTGTITVGGNGTAATFETRWVDQIGDSTAVNVLGNGTLRVTATNYEGQFPAGNLAEIIGSLNVSGGSIVETVSGATSIASIVLNGDLTHDGLGTTSSTISGNLSLGSGVRTLSIGNSAAAADLTISAVISNGGMRKTGTGTLLLSGANTYAGTTVLTSGTTVINGNQSAATGAVTVSSGATLSGTGTLGGATTVAGIHSPGAAGNGVGRQIFNNGLSYDSGSIFSWDLISNSTTSGFDTLSGNGALSVNNNAIFRIVLGSGVNLSATFWNTNRSWTSIVTGLTGGSFNNSLLQVVTTGGNPVNLSSIGRFTVSGATVNWSPIPEPSSAVVGLLLVAGLCRRKRA